MWDTGEFASLFPEITAFTERLRFNVLYKGPQKFACTEIPLRKSKPSGRNAAPA